MSMKYSFIYSLASIFLFFVITPSYGQMSEPVISNSIADHEESGCCCSSDCQSRRMAVCEMWDREMPDGTQHGHLRYWSTGIYYYHRPYNAMHYRQHRARLQSTVRPYAPFEAQHGFSRGYQYAESNPSHLFRPLVREADPAKDEVDSFDASRVLEFADSVRYRHAKTAWDKKREQEKGKRIPARLSSHAK